MGRALFPMFEVVMLGLLYLCGGLGLGCTAEFKEGS